MVGSYFVRMLFSNAHFRKLYKFRVNFNKNNLFFEFYLQIKQKIPQIVIDYGVYLLFINNYFYNSLSFKRSAFSATIRWSMQS